MRSRSVALNQKRRRTSSAPAWAALGARVRAACRPGRSGAATWRMMPADARRVERIRAVEQQLHLRSPAQRVAPEVGGITRQRERRRRAAAAPRPRRSSRPRAAAGSNRSTRSPRRGAARARAAVVEHGPRHVGGLVRERAAEEQQHHERLHDHDRHEGLVVPHHGRLAVRHREHVRDEAAAAELHARRSSVRSASARAGSRRRARGSRARAAARAAPRRADRCARLTRM